MAGSQQPSQQSQSSYTALFLPVIQTHLSAAPYVHLVFHQLQDQTRTSITAPIHVPRLLKPLILLDLTLAIAIPSIYKISRHRPGRWLRARPGSAGRVFAGNGSEQMAPRGERELLSQLWLGEIETKRTVFQTMTTMHPMRRASDVSEIDVGLWEFPQVPWESNPDLSLLPSLESRQSHGQDRYQGSVYGHARGDSPFIPGSANGDCGDEAQILDGHGQHLSGWLLYALVAGLTMAAFLLMIDSTILVTVCSGQRFYRDSMRGGKTAVDHHHPGYPDHHDILQLVRRHGVVRQLLPPGDVCSADAFWQDLHVLQFQGAQCPPSPTRPASVDKQPRSPSSRPFSSSKPAHLSAPSHNPRPCSSGAEWCLAWGAQVSSTAPSPSSRRPCRWKIDQV